MDFEDKHLKVFFCVWSSRTPLEKVSLGSTDSRLGPSSQRSELAEKPEIYGLRKYKFQFPPPAPTRGHPSPFDLGTFFVLYF